MVTLLMKFSFYYFFFNLTISHSEWKERVFLHAIAVGGAEVKEYLKTDGAWIYSQKRKQYSVNTLNVPPNVRMKHPSVASKITSGTNYFHSGDQNLYHTQKHIFVCLHRSFMYAQKHQECWTAGANSKTGSTMRRSSTALYERNCNEPKFTQRNILKRLFFHNVLFFV